MTLRVTTRRGGGLECAIITWLGVQQSLPSECCEASISGVLLQFGRE